MRKIVVCFFLLACQRSFGQTDTLRYTDINKVLFADTLTNRIISATVEKNFSLEKDYSTLKFQPGHPYRKGIPPKAVTKKIIVGFNISNNSDTVKDIYFLPGVLFEDIVLYRKDSAGVTRLPRILPRHSDSIGYRMIRLTPHDSATIFAELYCLKTYTNNLRPRLINSAYLPNYIIEMHNNHHDLDQMTYIFS